MTARSTVYIAGPMRGYPGLNFDAFYEAETWLAAHGYHVHNPARNDEESGFDPDKDTPQPIAHYMAQDLPLVCASQVVVALPGWVESEGARMEIGLAVDLSTPVCMIDRANDALVNIDAETELRGREDPVRVDCGGEVRIVDPDTGGEKGQKLARFDLIPTRPLWKVAEHYGTGAKKYKDRNWEKGYKWSLSYGALQRHATAFWSGETIDPETGSHHMAAVVFHALALMEYGETNQDKDDRPKRTEAIEND